MLIFFPTSSPSSNRCIWISYSNIDRYVKEDISKNEYLELNRFCMADSEGKNSES